MGRNYRFSVDISAENRNVTGSLNLISVHRAEGDIHFLVDCGIYYCEKKDDDACNDRNYRPFGFNPENIDFVLLTHVHADHSARIPLLYKKGFCKKTYCSHDTKHLLSFALNDSAKVIKLNAKKAGRRHPLYEASDVARTMEAVVAKEWGETFEPCEGVKVTLFKNAHLIGAATILVQIESAGEKPINLLFLGDFHCRNLFFYVPPLPKWVKELPLHVITESTYGKVDSVDTDKPVFCRNIAKWLKNGKKTIIIPSLSLGRFQHICYMLKKMQDTGKLDKAIPIWLDGNLAITYTIAFQKYLNILADMRKFMPVGARFVEDKSKVLNYPGTQIIVATAGNANFGPVPEYISAFVEKPTTAIHFTSFLTDDSLGYRLLNTGSGKFVSVHSVMRKKRAEVKTTAEFSGHAKRDQIVGFLSTLKVKTLHITHGEEPTKYSFGEYCKVHLNISGGVAIAGVGFTHRIYSDGHMKPIKEKGACDT